MSLVSTDNNDAKKVGTHINFQQKKKVERRNMKSIKKENRKRLVSNPGKIGGKNT